MPEPRTYDLLICRIQVEKESQQSALTQNQWEHLNAELDMINSHLSWKLIQACLKKKVLQYSYEYKDLDRKYENLFFSIHQQEF